jgi:hypothetical protein
MRTLCFVHPLFTGKTDQRFCGQSRPGLREQLEQLAVRDHLRRPIAELHVDDQAEVVVLREADCVVPARGWGRIDLAVSQPRAGAEWTDDGASREERGLKHRAANESRSIPIPPVLVAMLRARIARYGPGPGGRLFRTARAADR